MSDRPVVTNNREATDMIFANHNT